MSEKIICYADDDMLFRMNFEMTLEDYGDYKVFLYENGEALLANIDKIGECHAIFLDYYMGENKLNGLEVIKKLKELNISCKIYIISNNINPEFQNLGIQTGATNCFAAPISLDILKETL